MSLTIVLITGANSGIGFATAQWLARSSQDIHVILASRSLQNAKDAVSKIEETDSTGRVSDLQLDVNDESSIKLAVATVSDRFGRLDVLINNAGIAVTALDSAELYQLCLKTNVVGPTLVSKAFRPLLLRSSNPYSIYISSSLASMGLASDPSSGYSGPQSAIWAPYRASKAALNMAALQDMVDSSSTPIKIFVACPGLVVSNLRGKDEESRTAAGRAGDPIVSAQMIASIIRGERDSDVGKFIHKGGVYPW